jgi:homoserine O-succinyltransferase/O-acetyltransferase
MTVRLTPVGSAGTGHHGEAPEQGASLRCAFVNNMPDGAFEATERQFMDLLAAGSGDRAIEVQRYAMSGVPRGAAVAARIGEQYAPLAALRENPPDAVIVTGSNPLEQRIRDEPYWGEMEDLFSWGAEHVPSMLFSCLSAHAALDHFDRIERVRLPSKRTGVFPQQVEGDQGLSAGLEPVILLPHSRLSDVPTAAMVEAGYDIVVQSDAIGWSVASKRIQQSDVVLLQGHPEYDPASLLREYHRDARRYVQRERAERPCLPWHCVSAEDWVSLQRLHEAITEGLPDPRPFEAYPFEEVGARAPWSWSAAAQQLFTNWLTRVATRSAHTDA